VNEDGTLINNLIQKRITNPTLHRKDVKVGSDINDSSNEEFPALELRNKSSKAKNRRMTRAI
jgi:hypothetical protein